MIIQGIEVNKGLIIDTPWVLNETKRIEPIPYTHPRGAVIWVNLP
ncbi:hypothetical protein [Vibrio parahaemolyticus]